MNKTIRNIVMIAVFSALFYVLDLFSIKIGMEIKITFSALPIVIIAMLLGYKEAMLVGLIGALIGQLTQPLSATTVLWILPAVIRGLILGLTIKGDVYKTKPILFIVMVILSGLITTGINSAVLYLDSNLYGYYHPGIISAKIVIRLVNAVICSIIYCGISPLVYMGLSKIVKE